MKSLFLHKQFSVWSHNALKDISFCSETKFLQMNVSTEYEFT